MMGSAVQLEQTGGYSRHWKEAKSDTATSGCYTEDWAHKACQGNTFKLFYRKTERFKAVETEAAEKKTQ